MKRTFIASDLFDKKINGHIDNENLRSMEIDIMNGLGKIIPGTNGLKKIRCGYEGKGKSGAWRVIYADYPQFCIVILITAFLKNVQENLTRDQMNILKELKAKLDKLMEKKYGKEK